MKLLLVGTENVYIATKTIKDATSFMLMLTFLWKHENREANG